MLKAMQSGVVNVYRWAIHNSVQRTTTKTGVTRKVIAVSEKQFNEKSESNFAKKIASAEQLSSSEKKG